LAGMALFSAPAMATEIDVTVTIENLAPANGNFLTPHWVGFHDGTFDIYDRGSAASAALEALAEDGNNGPLSQAFASEQQSGVDATIAGPGGPIAPGDIATATFRLDSNNASHRYFSYASMLLPSNDFFFANGNPLEQLVFDGSGNFVATNFFVSGSRVLDAGTEVNDEQEFSTAFLGQSQPNSGVTENGVITIAESFLPGGRILSDPRFAMADFSVDGYPLVKISFTAVEVVENPIVSDPVFSGPLYFAAELGGDQEVPPVATSAAGSARYTIIRPEGDRLVFSNIFESQVASNITAAHLHLGAAGENGPVVVNLLPAEFDVTDPVQARRANRQIDGIVTASDLIGPLEGRLLGALTSEILNGNVYVNIHTSDVPSGELRGQLFERTF